MSTVDYSTATVATNHISYKGRKVAERHALEYANLYPNVEDVKIALGVPFLSTVWNGAEEVPTWLVYDVSVTDEGHTISSYRFSTNPLEV